MICLGIESTAHTFGVGMMDDGGNVLSNVTDTFIPERGWGIKPDEAAKHHSDVKERVLEEALENADSGIRDVDIISFSQGPGLPPCLWEGTNFARELSQEYGIPSFGVAHTVSHIEIGRLKTGAEDPVTLYVSGGNTQVIGYSRGRYRILGEVLDTPIGNALDKFGRDVGMEFPGGPKIEEKAEQGQKFIDLPYSVKGMDLSFSGLVTEAQRKYEDGEDLEDVCYSIQEVAFSMLTEVVERAMAHTGKDEVLLTGGVAANSRLQEMLDTMCKERDGSLYTVPHSLAGDNGAMIAWTGILKSESGGGSVENYDIKPMWRTDEVDITWM